MKLFAAGAIVLALLGIGSAPAALAHGRRSFANAEQVRQVQQKLNDMGYHAGSVDGVLGPQTESALRQFQQARKLDATGHIDSNTLAASIASRRATRPRAWADRSRGRSKLRSRSRGG